MMKWTTKFSTVLGCALAAVFLFTSTMEVGAVPLTSSPVSYTHLDVYKRQEEAEWKILPQAIDLIAQGRVTVVDGKTIIAS